MECKKDLVATMLDTRVVTSMSLNCGLVFALNS